MRQFKISHPGEILAREIADMGISVQDFEPAFLQGKMVVTPELAIRISAIVGSTPDFWLRLQHSYDLRLDEIEQKISDN